MHSIQTSIEWDMGHRLMEHEGKCRHLHGHRYKAVFHVFADELDSVGRVVDFGTLRRNIGNWINQTWDHKLMLQDGDEFATAIGAISSGDDLVIVPYSPTAENIAKGLYDAFIGKFPTLYSVDVWETPNCMASYNGLA